MAGLHQANDAVKTSDVPSMAPLYEEKLMDRSTAQA